MSAGPSREVLARNVWRLRIAQGLTQAQLAGKMGYQSGASCVSDAELAVHALTLDTVDRFAAVLGVTAAALLTPQAEDPPPRPRGRPRGEPRGGGCAWEEAARAVLGWIASGRLQAGERLPATTALGTELGVSDSTMIRALEELASRGALHRTRRFYYAAAPAPEPAQ